MAHVFSSTYVKSRNYVDDDYLTTVEQSSIKVRSVEGLRITIDLSLHYKVGVSFNN
jgi:hypothetical protein